MGSLIESAIRWLNRWVDRRWAARFELALLKAFQRRKESILPGMPGEFDYSIGSPEKFRYFGSPFEASVELMPFHGFSALLTYRITVARLPIVHQARVVKASGDSRWEMVAEKLFGSEPDAAQLVEWALSLLEANVTEFDAALNSAFCTQQLDLDELGPEVVQGDDGGLEDSGWVYFVELRDPGLIGLSSHLDLSREYHLGIAYPHLGTVEGTYAVLSAPGTEGRWHTVAKRSLTPPDSPADLAKWVRVSIEQQPSWIDEPG